MDIRYNADSMDITTPMGSSNALFYALNLKVGASATTAPVCSTFVVVKHG